MKFVMLIIAMIIFDNGCKESKINQDSISLEYSAHSRGTYLTIAINKKNISVVNKRGAKATIIPCSESEWRKIIKLVKSIDIKNIAHLKAPTNARFYDGAAIAKFKIWYDSTLYESSSFDHGNPPKELKSLIDEMVSFSKINQ